MSKGLAIIYDRASTRKQEANYTRQDVMRIGTEVAARYGYHTEAQPRYEVKSGEELRNREVMKGILADIEAGKVSAVIVPNLTRLSRDEDIIDGLVIKQICRASSVVVIDFNGKLYNFENDNDQDSALLEFWFASRDKRQLLSNVMRGQKEKAMQGKYMGGFAPLGYRIALSGEVNKRGVHLKKREIDPTEAQLVRRIFKLYSKMSATRVAAALNSEGIEIPIKNKNWAKARGRNSRPFLNSDIMRIVKNPLYAGWMRWNTGDHYGRPRSKYLRDFEPQMHFDPPLQIISQDEFDRVQRIRKERYDIPHRAVSTKYPFSFILKCVNCGGPLGGGTYHYKNTAYYRRHYYRCNNRWNNPKVCSKGQNIGVYAVASAVIPFTAKLLQDKMELITVLKNAAQDQDHGNTLERLEAETRAQLEKTNQGIQRITKAIAADTISNTEAKDTLAELRDQKERLTRDLQGMREDKTVRAELLEAIEYIQGNLERALWNLFEVNTKILTRIMRLVFKRHTVSVEPYWDTSVPGPCYSLGKRKGKLMQYELQEAFVGLDADMKHSLAQEESENLSVS